MDEARPDIAWGAPDADGVRSATLDDPLRSTLGGKRLRRAFDRPEPDIDTWPAAWRELLTQWCRRASPETRLKWDSLLGRAGAALATSAEQLRAALLAGGLVEVGEQRDRRLGWQLKWLRFIDPAGLRRRLRLPEPDAARQAWEAARQCEFGQPELDAAARLLDALPPARALARLELLEKLSAWLADGRSGTWRDFAQFARGGTKAVSEAEKTWLGEQLTLADFGVSAHQPLLFIRAPFSLITPHGRLDLSVVPDLCGVTPDTIALAISIDRQPAGWRMVENRTSFERAARQYGDTEAVIWLPGYPPGWWRESVRRLLALAPAPARIACDPDPDGIAIACTAGAIWEHAGLAWTPWKMDSGDLAQLQPRAPLSDRDRERLKTMMDKGIAPPTLARLADWMLAHGEKGEQEGLI
ncbi:MAG: DUF2399 domain-containing protein [Zoogloea sp.]|nr:DUF2399 domain-containing protein [Zoogloea sp.]